MKKTILLFVAFATQISFAQNVFPLPSGNVGVGTTSPISTLDVIGSAKFRENNGSYYSELSSDANNAYLRSYGVANSLLIYDILGKPLVMQPYSGNVGIGTFNPDQKLVVNGNAVVKGAIISSIPSDTGGHIQLVNSTKNGNGIASTWMIYNMTGGYGNSLQFWAYDNLSCGGGMCNNRFTIMDNGNVGIGIGIPNNKLDVNGTIHSKEVKVDMSGWSDFVFKKEYDLPTLEEVEKHIAEKGHLENIPSEAEVVKNGVNLGEMNAKLLQKIEELTLYMIEMKKENDEMKKQNYLIKAENNLIKKDQNDLAKQIKNLLKN